MFSSRTPAGFTPNRLARAVAAARAAGRPFVDLTTANPTAAGFDYPPDLLQALADPRGLRYAPEPLGSMDVRRAVSAEYARRGFTVTPERVVLTSSTSEAYSLLFKLLCDPGDRVLVPRPSYPLFEHLAGLDGVRVSTYDLDHHGRWSVDLRSVERAFADGARAFVAVHPNNPTGSFLQPDELDAVAALCAAGDAALVADEVFAEYELTAGAEARAARILDRHDVLAISLGGLSKSAGLPQLKLGWMAVSGPDLTVAALLERLEFACDAYLSVSTPVQLAAGRLLAGAAAVRRQIQVRIAANYRRLQSAAAGSPCTALAADGGWHGVLQVPRIDTEEALVLALLEEEGVLAHPGYFFDFPHEAYLVLSLLADERSFADGVARIVSHFVRRCRP